MWWQKFHKGQLSYTRPYLIEIMHSDDIQISNLTLINSPSWNVHPVYSRFVFFSLRCLLSIINILHYCLDFSDIKKLNAATLLFEASRFSLL